MSVKTKLILFAINALLLVGSAFFGYSEYKKNIELNIEVSDAKSSIRSYEQIVDGLVEQNSALNLTVGDLSKSKDKKVLRIKEVADSLKIDLNSNNSIASGIDVSFKDTTIVSLPILGVCELDTIIKKNSETTYNISLRNNELILIEEINNSTKLYVYPRREYVNRYSGWFKRLIHLDYKKANNDYYNIVNSNKLIKTLDARVIKMNEE